MNGMTAHSYNGKCLFVPGISWGKPTFAEFRITSIENVLGFPSLSWGTYKLLQLKFCGVAQLMDIGHSIVNVNAP